MAQRSTPFGKYFLLERINVGGMAEVFKARTVGIDGFEKIVALKRILPAVARDEELIRMFVDEAKITSQLSHANLAQTFDLGQVDGAFYIAMEYVPGKDLRAAFDRLNRRGERMPPGLCAYVLARVCDGLDYAHRKRDLAGRELHIVHRDVSPQNVILSFEGEVKLIDFGIARSATRMTRTQAGILKGKFGYMSPEQARGLELDGRSDIFAAGIVLYELCTGERLFTGDSDANVLAKVQQAKVTPPSLLEPSIPSKLERVILKALAREPAERYRHAADLAADLQRYLLDSQPRPVAREDVAALMKSLFPDERAREAQAAAFAAPGVGRKSRLRGRRPAQGLEEKLPGTGDPGATFRGPAPAGAPRAEIIVRSKLAPQDRSEPARTAGEPHLATTQPDARAPLVQGVGAGEGAPSSAAAAQKPCEQKTEARPRSEPYGLRREMFGPIPAGPALPGENSIASPRQRAAWPRRAKLAAVALVCGTGVAALAFAAWSLLSPPRSSSERPANGTASLATLEVTTDPPDAVLLLDGAQVKGKGDEQFNDPRLAAGVQHVLIARRAGYGEQSLTVNLERGERRALVLRLVAEPGDLVIRSSPPGARVFLDGERKGLTPARLSGIDAGRSHAVSLEKTCYRAWQVAIPAHSGHLELAASLEPAGSACPGEPVRSGARKRGRR